MPIEKKKKRETVMIRIDKKVRNRLKIEAAKKGLTMTQLLRLKLE